MSPVQAPSLSRPVSAAPRSKKSLWPLTIAVSVIILLAGWWFLWLPQWRSLQALPPVDGFETTRQAVAAELASLNKFIEEYDKLTATDLKRLDLALPKGQDIPNLLAQFEGIAKATNFSISDIGFSTAKVRAEPQGLPGEEISGTGDPSLSGLVTESSAQELRVNVVIEGGEYADLKEFIASAEQSVRLLKLTSITFTTKSAGRGGVAYTLNFQTVYLP